MKNSTHKNQKAFTIVETLVAIFILSLSITGPLFFVSNTFQLARIAKYEMTAYFLATETLEQVKYERDYILGNLDPAVSYSPDSWISSIEEVQDNSNAGYFDANTSSASFQGCNEENSIPKCEYLLYTPEEGFHYGLNNSSAPESPFYRHAKIETTESESERKVTVTVGWNDGVIDGELEIIEYIYDFNG